ncbi:hypothetical protein LOD99_11410, partial [Oopsacas minuta]
MRNHLEECPAMLLKCELKCGTVVSREDMAQHLEKYCRRGIEHCKLGCGIELSRDELEMHVNDECVQRMIPCKHCKRNFKVCDISNHLEECPKMLLKCELKCGTVVCREEMAEHLNNDCGRVIEHCKLGCGIELPRDELEMHVNDECVQRMIPCKHCKRDFKVCDLSKHLEECLKMLLKCELKCGTVVSREDMAQHLEKYCRRVIEHCKLGCGIELSRDELEMHVNDECVQRMIPCKHCKRELKVCDMRNHLEECPKMLLKCELRCGTVVSREDMAQHLEKYCRRGIEHCKLGCGIELPRDELEMHVNDECVQRMIPCKHCKRDFKVCDISNHLEECPKLLLKCELKCGTVVCREEMAEHLNNDCGRVIEHCKLGCGIELPRDELDMHVNDECVQRMIPCKHCKREFKVCDMRNHLEECPAMLLKCELKCGTVVSREDMAQHLEKYCRRGIEHCKLGCGIELPRDELKIHVNTKCVQRMMPCEYCHIDFKACDMSNHNKKCQKMPI